MNFDLARPLAAISGSRDFQQMNKFEIARKRLEVGEMLQRNTRPIGKPGSDFHNPSLALTLHAP